MTKKLIWIIGAAVAVILFIGAVILYNALGEKYAPDNIAETTQDTSSESVGEDSADNTSEGGTISAPDFTATDADGNEVKLSDYFGKPIVLNFWASWCGYCLQEMPDFEEIYKENPDVQFLMVNATSSQSETAENAKKVISENGYTFPVIYDTKGEAANVYNISSLPITYFIDENGNLVTYGLGRLDKASVEKGIELIK